MPHDSLGIGTSGPTSTGLLLENVGAGYVEYTIRIASDQPWAFVSTPRISRGRHTQQRRLPPGATDNSVRVGVQADQFPTDATRIVVTIVSADRGGNNAEDFRPWDVNHNRWRTWNVYVPVRRLGPANIRLDQGLVIFTAKHRRHIVRVANTGGSDAAVSVEALPPHINAWWERPADNADDDVISIDFDDTPARPARNTADIHQPQTVPAESAINLILKADAQFHGATTLALHGPEESRELLLWGQPPEQAADIVRHWTVGIDFGTAKSAVYYTDNRLPVENRDPMPILWPASPADEQPTETITRSAMLFNADSDVPACGHNVVVSAGAEGPGELVVESIKSKLRARGPEARIQLPSGHTETSTDLVARFLRYILSNVRASEPFRGDMDMDAEFVLSLPVMDDPRARQTQREHTLQAAERAGLPIDKLLTPTEPECAALDLMHSLRRGQYTFDGSTYHLQDNEIILVFDCGAGTTDVAILRTVLSEGRFQAEHIATAGYRFGGDTVDDLLLSWVLEEQIDAVRFGYSNDRPALRLPNLDNPITLHAAREECRRVKESLFVPGAGRERRQFHTDLGLLHAGPADVERLVVPFLQTFFTQGIMPDPALFFPHLAASIDRDMRRALWREMVQTAQKQVRTLQTTLSDADLHPSQVTFLFVTGGTGQIRIIARRLYDFMGHSARVVVASPDDCTINVARGAALHYDYRLRGMLPCAVDIIGRRTDSGEEIFRENALSRGALPGAEKERNVRLGAYGSLQVGLAAECPDGTAAGTIASKIVRNESPSVRQLAVHVKYDSDYVLHWQAEFADGQVVVPRQAVLGN